MRNTQIFFRNRSNRISISGTIPSWVYALLYDEISTAAHAFLQRSSSDETRDGKQIGGGGMVRGKREINNYFELLILMK